MSAVRVALGAVAALATCALLAVPAGAATYKPTRKDDPKPSGCKAHDCSLREAVIAANKHGGQDTIRLSKGTYRLTREEPVSDPNDSKHGDLDITGEAKLVGVSAERTAISADFPSTAGRALHFQGTLNGFSLSDLTVEGGEATTGGGILADNIGGSLRLKRVIVSQNIASSSGGGIYSSAAKLKITKSTIADNQADSQGGGIYLPATGGATGAKATIRASTISGNEGIIRGGGILATGKDDGGFPNPPELNMLNSTVAGNLTSGRGGGIEANEGATVTLDNVTLAYNEAERDGAGAGTGGGINRDATAGAFTIGDVLLGGNTIGPGGSGSQCAGTFAGLNGNVVQAQLGTLCNISGTTTQPADPMIGLLGDNGGPTQTVPLLSDSAAVGYAESCTQVDQRGEPRPATDCDAGAFELPAP